MKLATPTNRCAQAIAKNKVLEIKHALGITIACLAGSVWVTLDNDIRDTVLPAGHSFTIDSNQRVLIQALDTASVSLIEPNQSPRIY